MVVGAVNGGPNTIAATLLLHVKAEYSAHIDAILGTADAASSAGCCSEQTDPSGRIAAIPARSAESDGRSIGTRDVSRRI